MNNRHCPSSQIRQIVPQLCNQEGLSHSRYNEDQMDNSGDNLKEANNYLLTNLDSVILKVWNNSNVHYNDFTLLLLVNYGLLAYNKNLQN